MVRLKTGHNECQMCSGEFCDHSKTSREFEPRDAVMLRDKLSALADNCDNPFDRAAMRRLSDLLDDAIVESRRPSPLSLRRPA